jgi:ketosteroid isomerase-like protein
VSANVDLVRSVFTAWERGDFGSVEWAHPQIEYVVSDGPDPGSRTGLAEMAGAWRRFMIAWGDYRVEADEYREIDRERVLVLLHAFARGRSSGADARQMRARGANLFHIDGGKVTRLIVCFDRERMLADLGLAQ